MLFMVYEVTVLPLQVAFDLTFERVFRYITWVENIIFFLDILLHFHTLVYKDGAVIHNHWLIAKHYLSKWFWIDLMACIPFQLLILYHIIEGEEWAITLLGLLRVLKIIRLAKTFRTGAFSKFKDFIHLSGEMNGLVRLFRLIVTIAFLAHWCACLWHLLGSHPIGDEGVTWITSFGFEHASVGKRYISSLYWACATLLTVGYGDLVATNMGERVFNICVMLLGSGVMGYSMNQVGDILQQINSEVNFRE